MIFEAVSWSSSVLFSLGLRLSLSLIYALVSQHRSYCWWIWSTSQPVFVSPQPISSFSQLKVSSCSLSFTFSLLPRKENASMLSYAALGNPTGGECQILSVFRSRAHKLGWWPTSDSCRVLVCSMSRECFLYS